MAPYRIDPVEVGSREHAESSLFLYLTDPGRTIEIRYRLWLVRDGERTVVVDTGLPLEEARHRGIEDAVAVDGPLRAAGVDPRDVELVVLTHLHWDHASNADAFPSAVFALQRTEFDSLRDPYRSHPSIGRFHSPDLGVFDRLAERGRLRLLDGDDEIVPGVEVLHVGGHTAGSHVVAVDVPDGRAVITGDAIPLVRNFTDDIPSGIHLDVRDAIAALKRVRDLRPVSLYTGHDVTARFDL